jgi:hypothetical protein
MAVQCYKIYVALYKFIWSTSWNKKYKKDVVFTYLRSAVSRSGCVSGGGSMSGEWVSRNVKVALLAQFEALFRHFTVRTKKTTRRFSRDSWRHVSRVSNARLKHYWQTECGGTVDIVLMWRHCLCKSQDHMWLHKTVPACRFTQALPRRSLRSKQHTVWRYTCKCEYSLCAGLLYRM